jgi:hypothetical protein
MLAFVDLIHALPTTGRKLCIQCWLHLRSWILNSTENLSPGRGRSRVLRATQWPHHTTSSSLQAW